MTADAITTTPALATTAPEKQALPGAGLALTLLVAINLFNYIDRQVLAAVEPEIRKALFPDSVGPNADRIAVEHAKTMMGWLSSAFLITYMLTSPIFGKLAERFSRWLLIGIGVMLWSVASGGSGWNWTHDLALAYWCLFATRCLVGVGEAVYGPVAPTVLSDLYPISRRGQVMAWFYLAIPVGGALGYALGETVAHGKLAPLLGEHLAGPEAWRWAFYLVVPPGLLLGLWCFLMREPSTGGADGVNTPRKVTWSDYWTLAQTPSYVFNTLGMTAMTFAIGGLAYWMADYLEYREVQPLAGIGPRTIFGIITVLAGFSATLLGGLAGDWLRPKFSGSYFVVSGSAMMLGFPMILLIIYTDFPNAWFWVFFAVFCLFFNTGPTNTILANVTHPSIRATAFAINILIIHLFGDVASPPLMGKLSGRWNPDVSFTVVSIAMLVGGLFWLWGSRYLERDTALAPTRLQP
jgi:MFS family permease